MGGDYGPRVIVAALLSSLRKHPGVSALLFGDQLKLEAVLSLCHDSALLSRIEVQHCHTHVSNSDLPSSAIREKRDSSMGLALSAVATGSSSACISAGNTGALMALGMVTLKKLPGISRPAICTTFPTSRGKSYILDLGANVDCNAQQLADFALLGSLTVKELEGINAPVVRLLNVGSEASKGSQLIKQTAELLESEPLLNYAGFVEGDGIFQGLADVVVCDGFSGNVALKTSEGVARMVEEMLESSVTTGWISRLGALFLRRPLNNLRSRLNPAQYNGAYLLGLQGVVVKSHGSADETAFGHAIDVAIDAAKHNLPNILSPILQSKLDSNQNQ
jgi:glycerol-3-phosphate acyltransferase PlsX